MPTSLRLILLCGSLLIFGNVLSYIRKRRILMASATGWVVMAVALLLIALFPDAIMYLASWLGFQSAANFVFLVVTGLLTVKTFRDSARMSIMRHKIEELTQEMALAERESQEGGDGNGKA